MEEDDPDKTSVVDVKKELGRTGPSLLDRLLDTSSSKDDTAHKASSDFSATSKSNSDSGPSADLFSGLNRPAKSETSRQKPIEDKSDLDDFEDLLLGGVNGPDSSSVVQPKSKDQHWTEQDFERTTETPPRSGAPAKKVASRVNAAPSEAVVGETTEVDEDATDEIKGDYKNPIGRQTSRPGRPAPPGSGSGRSGKPKRPAPPGSGTAKPGKAKRRTPPAPIFEPKVPQRGVSAEPESKPSDDDSKDTAESTIVSDKPTNKAGLETSKPDAKELSETESSNRPSVSARASDIRKRARKKADAAKKRLAEELTLEEANPSAADLVKEDTTSQAQDTAAELKTSNYSEIPSRKIEELDEVGSAEGTETAVTGEIDRRGRGFKVSTELVKQSLRPPPQARARKVRRVIRHIDPWSVLTFSVLFHLTIFSSLLLGAVLIWQVAAAAGTIANLEDIIKDLGSFESYELKGWAMFRAAVAIAAIFTLASTILVVIMSVIFNLISDLVGGIRVTVVQEESVRVQRDK